MSNPNVDINGVTYPTVPSVEIPINGSQDNAVFYYTGDDDAVAGDVLSGKTFHSNGAKTGGMTNNGAVTGSFDSIASPYTVPAGYHNGSGTVNVSAQEQAKIVAGNIKTGVSILGVSGSFTSDADATASDILSGRTAYVNGSKITGNMTAATVAQDSTTKVLTIS